MMWCNICGSEHTGESHQWGPAATESGAHTVRTILNTANSKPTPLAEGGGEPTPCPSCGHTGGHRCLGGGAWGAQKRATPPSSQPVTLDRDTYNRLVEILELLSRKAAQEVLVLLRAAEQRKEHKDGS